MAHRYFLDEITGDTAFLSGQQAQHVARVLRAKPEDILILCDGEGNDYTAEITYTNKETVSLAIIEKTPSISEPNIQVHLFLGYAKGDRMDWAIQKAVELGVKTITPFFSEKCVIRPAREEEKNRRFSRLCQAAAEQSGRGVIPRVNMPVSFAQMTEQASRCGTALFCYEGGGVSLRQATACLSGNAVALITGAEGGFTPQEAREAEEAGHLLVGLGPRILRCETAPIAALAAIMSYTGNLE